MTKGEIAQEGFVNTNRQVALKADERFASNHAYAKPWRMYCLECDCIYGANSCDIHLRCCPNCQNGVPGLPRTTPGEETKGVKKLISAIFRI